MIKTRQLLTERIKYCNGLISHESPLHFENKQDVKNTIADFKKGVWAIDAITSATSSEKDYLFIKNTIKNHIDLMIEAHQVLLKKENYLSKMTVKKAHKNLQFLNECAMEILFLSLQKH